MLVELVVDLVRFMVMVYGCLKSLGNGVCSCGFLCVHGKLAVKAWFILMGILNRTLLYSANLVYMLDLLNSCQSPQSASIYFSFFQIFCSGVVVHIFNNGYFGSLFC